MKTIWVHVNDKTVPTEECCGSLRTDKNFDSSKIRDMLCREVSHEIGRNSNTNYSKKTECHTLYFHCPIKNAQCNGKLLSILVQTNRHVSVWKGAKENMIMMSPRDVNLYLTMLDHLFMPIATAMS